MPSPLQIRRRISRTRRHAGGRAMKAFFAGASALGQFHPQARRALSALDIVRDVAYGPDQAHRLDVYQTPNPSRQARPVVLYIHGGGFRILSKKTHWIMALAFARHGFVVFNIDYRLAPEYQYPAALEDASQALRWVHAHADQYGGDPEQIVIAGESAGANLALSLGIACAWKHPAVWAQSLYEACITPRALLPACGMLQVSDPERIQRRKPHLSRFVTERLEEVARGYLGAGPVPFLELADPVVFLEEATTPDRALAPVMATVGTKDPLLDDSRRLGQALVRLKVPHAVRYYPGEVHAFSAFVWRAQAQQCWRDQLEFLADLGVGVRPL